MPDVKLQDVISAESIKKYVDTVKPIPRIGYFLFPAKKQFGIELSTIRGFRNQPVALKPSAFDVSVKIRSLKAQVKEETKEMPFFKEAVVLKEKDRQNLLLAMSANNAEWRNLILDTIYSDITTLVDGAELQAERMRMQLLAYGRINIVSDDSDIVLDYGLPTDNKETLAGTSAWTDHVNSNPVLDIERWKAALKKKNGTKLVNAICSESTWLHIQQNEKIISDIQGPAGTAIITESDILNYIKAKCGVTIEVIGDTFLLEDGKTSEQLFPDFQFTLLPDGALGSTYYGTTPEEADLITTNVANVKIVRDGIAITSIPQTDPVTILNKVSQVVLPSFERIDQVFIATVGA